MLYNIGYTNTVIIYCHSTAITKVMLLYNTEWQYVHGMAVNYCGKKFITLGPGVQLFGSPKPRRAHGYFKNNELY